MLNVEALYPSEESVDPFAEARAFRHFPTKYCSYTNGKSFGRLDADDLRSHGPHHFQCALGAGGAKSAGLADRCPPHAVAPLQLTPPHALATPMGPQPSTLT